MEAQTAIAKNEEHHDFMASLAERRFYGEVTFYIQDGIVESCRVSERHTKKELLARMEARRRKILIPRPKGKASADNG